MREHAAGSARRSRLLHVMQWVVAAGAIAYLVSTLPGVRPDGGYSTILDSWLGNGVLFGAMALCLFRGILIRAERAAWLALGIGIGVWALGRVGPLAGRGDPPLPPLAGGCRAGFFPPGH